MDEQVTSGEIVEVVREMFPREFDIAALTAVVRRQAARIAQLEATQAGVEPDAR